MEQRVPSDGSSTKRPDLGVRRPQSGPMAMFTWAVITGFTLWMVQPGPKDGISRLKQLSIHPPRSGLKAPFTSDPSMVSSTHWMAGTVERSGNSQRPVFFGTIHLSLDMTELS